MKEKIAEALARASEATGAVPARAAPAFTRRIAFINEKGGTCKTTLAVNTAAYLAGDLGERVLLIDFDPQGQAGKVLGLDVRSLTATAYEWLLHGTDAVQHTSVPGLDIIASNKRLSEAANVLPARADRDLCLKQRLVDMRGYDYIVFDSPPSLGLLTRNIILASQEVVVPVALTYLALDGCAEIVETIDQVKRDYGVNEPRVSMVVPTFYRRTKMADEILSKLREHFPEQTSNTVISYDVKIDEAQSHGATIFQYAPRSNGAHMMENLAKEVVRGGKRVRA